ncbi:MAG: hypothetical protein HKO64_10170 [Xanthomonadales bacterium]|nr:hypothetical protein [Gammaproteobacteria bacterium]NNE04297.1 hypothetical protein [Xanthomonadales bacterium]NNL95973.1 hypothetical protein [Xanthomonadales bacterium]
MNKLTITAACCLLAATAWAGPEHDGHEVKAKAVSGAKLSAKTTTRESVTPELSKIVVLCANEQEKQFEKEWKQYVDKHELKGPELKETIAWVSKEAASQRKKEGKLKGDKDEEAWAEKRREFMRQVADRALNPAR